jgi:hypothetical protein
VASEEKQQTKGDGRVVTFGVGMNRIVPARPTQHPDETYTHTSGPPPTPYCLLLLVRGHIYPPVFAKKSIAVRKASRRRDSTAMIFLMGGFIWFITVAVAQQRNQRKTRGCPKMHGSWIHTRQSHGSRRGSNRANLNNTPVGVEPKCTVRPERLIRQRNQAHSSLLWSTSSRNVK